MLWGLAFCPLNEGESPQCDKEIYVTRNISNTHPHPQMHTRNESLSGASVNVTEVKEVDINFLPPLPHLL